MQVSDRQKLVRRLEEFFPKLFQN